jgi:leucyl-tRNA synthetase
MHWTTQKVSDSMDSGLRTHTAITAIMELVNECSRKRGEADPETLRLLTATAASLLFPFAPHCSTEVYQRITGKRVWDAAWPVADQALLGEDEIQVIVQVNGKLCDRVSVSNDALPEELKTLTRQSPRVRARIDGNEILKEVVVPGKLVNFVIRPRGRELA